ncbi:MAG TPA: DUF1559 domain-containing protein, partial [Candidatus Brocadiia bacterium]|nr:DUF1559 domain-containing protein [Candidatus Brocadiia bacterium]
LVVVAIIAILAAMLLPALSAAREKARRSSCMTNMNQMAKALLAYCGDYGDYIPSWAGYGEHTQGLANVRPAAPGKVTDPISSLSISTHAIQNANAGYWGGTWKFEGVWTRHIARGAYESVRTAAVGDIRTGPVGLGYLLVGGYLSDGRIFYCPSASNMPPTCGKSHDQVIKYPSTRAKYSLTQWAVAGGYSAKVLTHGAWEKCGDDSPAQGTYSYSTHVLAQYVYRGLPEPDEYTNKPSRNVAYTKPVVKSNTGCPPFKTLNVQANRAIAADSFCQLCQNGFADINRPYGAADGIFAHRDGYNVLYGDGHAAWYGDPTQRLIWQYTAIE